MDVHRFSPTLIDFHGGSWTFTEGALILGGPGTDAAGAGLGKVGVVQVCVVFSVLCVVCCACAVLGRECSGGGVPLSTTAVYIQNAPVCRAACLRSTGAHNGCWHEIGCEFGGEF